LDLKTELSKVKASVPKAKPGTTEASSY